MFKPNSIQMLTCPDIRLNVCKSKAIMDIDKRKVLLTFGVKRIWGYAYQLSLGSETYEKNDEIVTKKY